MTPHVEHARRRLVQDQRRAEIDFGWLQHALGQDTAEGQNRVVGGANRAKAQSHFSTKAQEKSPGGAVTGASSFLKVSELRGWWALNTGSI
jgi:hypothetical protein